MHTALKEIVQDCHLSILVGSGMSMPYLTTLGSIEILLTEIDGRDDLASDQRKLMKAALYKKYFIDVAGRNVSILKPDAAALAVLEQYRRFFQALGETLLRRKTPILSKEANVFTTNIDIFMERALEDLQLDYNDGFNCIRIVFRSERYHRGPPSREIRLQMGKIPHQVWGEPSRRKRFASQRAAFLSQKTGALLYGIPHVRSVFAKVLAVERFDKDRQRQLPRLLVGVIELTESVGVHSKLASHLHVSVGKMMALTCSDPRLQMIGDADGLRCHVGRFASKVARERARFSSAASFGNVTVSRGRPCSSRSRHSSSRALNSLAICAVPFVGSR